MILRIHASEIVRAAEHSLPWWDTGVRWSLGLVALGSGGIEADEAGNPTGWVEFADPTITVWEIWLLDLLRAGWAYVDGLPEEQRDPTVAFQAAADWQAWAGLRDRVDTGEITPADAIEQARAYAIDLAATLGVDPPDTEAL